MIAVLLIGKTSFHSFVSIFIHVQNEQDKRFFRSSEKVWIYDDDLSKRFRFTWTEYLFVVFFFIYNFNCDHKEKNRRIIYFYFQPILVVSLRCEWMTRTFASIRSAMSVTFFYRIELIEAKWRFLFSRFVVIVLLA